MVPGLGLWLLALAWALGSAVAFQSDEIQATASAVWWQAGNTGTLRCTYSSNASYVYVAWYRQRPGGPLQYLLQSKGRGGSYSHTAPSFRQRFSCQADESSGTLFISRLELEDSALYYCALQGLRLGHGLHKLVFGSGTTLTVEPSIQESSVPQVILMKSKKLKDDSTGKAACLARNVYTKNISLDMSSNEVAYEPSASILTSEGLYDTIKVVSLTKGTEVDCMANFNNRTIRASTSLAEENAEDPEIGKVCNTTDTSAQGTKVEKANMLSVAVLGLRVLLAKSIAFNTLMSIKLFLF